jgi:hypothetical protein
LKDANEAWLDVETRSGAITNIINNYSRSPSRFRVVTEGGSTIEFTLIFGFTATIRNRGDITSIQLREDQSSADMDTREDPADD